MIPSDPPLPETPSIESRPRGWASDRELARYFSVSRATIWRWARDGRLPPPEKLSPGVTRWRWSDALTLDGQR